MLTYDIDGNLEKVEDVTMVAKVPKRHFKKGTFCIMRKDFLLYLILEKDIFGNLVYSYLDIRVLAYLIDNIDFNNRVKSFKQEELAKAIGSTQSRVSKSLSKLHKKGVVFKNGLDYYFSDQFIKFAEYEEPKRLNKPKSPRQGMIKEDF